MTNRVARVAVVDDHELVVSALQERIDADPALEFAGSADTVGALIRSTPPAELVILDLHLPDGSHPSENVRRLNAWGAAVLVLTSGEDPFLMREVSRAGVLGIVRKSAPADRILGVIRAAAQGEPFVSSEWAAVVESDPQLGAAPLSDREREVLGLYASGLGAKSVAQRLHISENTVMDHVRRIRAVYAQLSRPANTKVDLYQRGLEDGYLPFPGSEEPSGAG